MVGFPAGLNKQTLSADRQNTRLEVVIAKDPDCRFPYRYENCTTYNRQDELPFVLLQGLGLYIDKLPADTVHPLQEYFCIDLEN